MNKLERLTKIRTKLGLSRRELAVISGVSQATITALEYGKTNIYNVKLLTLVELAKALKVKVIDLVPQDIKKDIA